MSRLFWLLHNCTAHRLPDTILLLLPPQVQVPEEETEDRAVSNFMRQVVESQIVNKVRGLCLAINSAAHPLRAPPVH